VPLPMRSEATTWSLVMERPRGTRVKGVPRTFTGTGDAVPTQRTAGVGVRPPPRNIPYGSGQVGGQEAPVRGFRTLSMRELGYNVG
jgi:hypothetical protein